MTEKVITREEFKEVANEIVGFMGGIISAFGVDEKTCDFCGLAISIAIAKIETRLFSNEGGEA